MPSITKVSSLDLKAGGTVQITGQNITQGTTLVELLNKNGKVVGLTVNSISGNVITATLPQSGLESGQYTLQLRFVGTGANFGKVSSGVAVNIQGSATTSAAGIQTGQQLVVGEKLGTNIVSGTQTSLTHVAVFINGDVNTLGKVSPGNVIEIGGQGLSGYDKFGLIINGQEYEVKKFSVSDSSIKLTVPTNLSANIPSGADVKVKLYSSSSSAAQGVVEQKLSYKNTTNQDNQDAVENDEVEAATDEETEAEPESEVEATEDDEDASDAETEESEDDSDEGLETEGGEEVEVAEDEGSESGNKTLASASKEDLSLNGAETDADEEADIDEETAEVVTGGGQNTSNSGGSVQLRGAANGIRGTINTLGSADQAWNGGLKMPAGYPASGVTAGLTEQNPTYKVKKGDTLWAIAKKHYGDGKKWRKILEANLDKVKDPKKLKIGAELVIPKL
jgi:nucleoid-associated protein YgaU